MLGYDVYRSDVNDKTYMGNYYSFDDPVHPNESYSLSLLVSKRPVYKE